MVSVLVPKGMATRGTGFSFPLPAEIATHASITASLADGASLPHWLKFDAVNRNFVANAVPDGAFPMQVVVTIGHQKTMIVISERNE